MGREKYRTLSPKRKGKGKTTHISSQERKIVGAYWEKRCCSNSLTRKLERENRLFTADSRLFTSQKIFRQLLFIRSPIVSMSEISNEQEGKRHQQKKKELN